MKKINSADKEQINKVILDLLVIITAKINAITYELTWSIKKS